MENAILYAKVIEKSLESGWIPPSPFGDDFSWTVVDDSFCMKNPIWDFHLSMVREQTISVSIERVLFDHSFAKALIDDVSILQKSICKMLMRLFFTILKCVS